MNQLPEYLLSSAALPSQPDRNFETPGHFQFVMDLP
jgi:hypothetical protein